MEKSPEWQKTEEDALDDMPIPEELTNDKEKILYLNYITCFSVRKTARMSNIPIATGHRIINKPHFQKAIKKYFFEMNKKFRQINIQNAYLAVKSLKQALEKGPFEKRQVLDKHGNKIWLTTIKPPSTEEMKLAMTSSKFYIPAITQNIERDREKEVNDKMLADQIALELKEMEKMDSG